MIPWDKLLDCTDKNVPRSTLANAVAVLQHDPEWGPARLYYDEFLDRVLIANSPTREWRDDDDTRLTVYMQEGPGLKTIPASQVAAAVQYVARQRVKNCVTDYLDGLTWDGEPRIALALEDCFGAVHAPDQPYDYVRAVSGNLFIGMIARARRPGCQLDTMPILEGAQGIGKSSALRILGGAHYAVTTESVMSKDFQQNIPGKWIIEIGEMDSFSRGEREKVKIAISTPVDRYRPSYGRRALDFPRRCVFVGTTNRDDYGNDDTGLRRFWPIRCTDILLDDIAAHRDQWFAEADAAFQSGASWWEVPASAAQVQRDRQQEDPWMPAVLEFVQFKDDVTSREILTDCLKFREADVEQKHQKRVSSILRLSGWQRGVLRRGLTLIKGFRPPPETDG